MSLALHELERFERRMLAALRIVDGASGTPLDLPIQMSTAEARIQRNRSGLYVITHWPALAAHAEAFEAPPGAPALGSALLQLTLRDPSGRYLPRHVALVLPRDPAPANATSADSLFRPLEVPMYPSSAAPLVGNWVALRVTLSEAGSAAALGGALLRVIAQGHVIARGLSDWRGEALVPVVGIPITTWSTAPDAVIVTEIAATLECVFAVDRGTRVSAADVGAGRAPASLPLVDPSALEAEAAGLPQVSAPVMLAAGRPLHLALQIALP
jgi:hypothetical protein